MSLIRAILGTPPAIGDLFECKYGGAIFKVIDVQNGRVVRQSADIYGELGIWREPYSDSIRAFNWRFNKIPTLVKP